jgi:hypothetical protein
MCVTLENGTVYRTTKAERHRFSLMREKNYALVNDSFVGSIFLAKLWINVCRQARNHLGYACVEKKRQYCQVSVVRDMRISPSLWQAARTFSLLRQSIEG